MKSYTPIGLGAFLYLRSSAQRQAMLPRIVAACGGTGRPIYVREDFSWATVQPTDGGAYDWSLYDSVVTDCANAGVKVLAIADQSPSWAVGGSGAGSYPCPPLASYSTNSGTSNALADYANFCSAIAARYGSNGTFWSSNPSIPYYPITEVEVWNEPYMSGSWKQWNGSTYATINSDPTVYAAIFSAAATKIHLTAGVLALAAVTTGTPMQLTYQLRI